MSVVKVLLAVILLAGIVWLAASSIGSGPGDHTQKYTFSQVLAQARTNPRVMQSVLFHPSTQEVEVRYQDGKSATVAYPVDASAFELQKVLESKQILFDSKSTGSSHWWSIVGALLLVAVVFGFWSVLLRTRSARRV